MQIPDIGGYPWFWTESETAMSFRITVLNTKFPPAAQDYRKAGIELVLGDATALDYADGAFDIVFSNSVVEHVGGFEKQVTFAKEVRRMGRGYWILTPAREFPIGPHLLAPFIHWLPRRMHSPWLVRHCTGWGVMQRPSKNEIQTILSEVRLLSGSEVRRLFPDATVFTERFFGLPKSYVAYRRIAQR
jgi:SAM-dependent methyltransferase